MNFRGTNGWIEWWVVADHGLDGISQGFQIKFSMS